MVNLVSENGTQKYGITNFVVDTPTDLINLSTTVAIGSTCFVISTSKTYMLNSSKEWIEIQVSSGGGGGGGSSYLPKNNPEFIGNLSTSNIKNNKYYSSIINGEQINLYINDDEADLSNTIITSGQISLRPDSEHSDAALTAYDDNADATATLGGDQLKIINNNTGDNTTIGDSFIKLEELDENYESEDVLLIKSKNISMNRQPETTVGANSTTLGKNNIASGDYSVAEGTSSIKPFSYIDYEIEDPFDPYMRPYGTIDNWVDNEGSYLVTNFNYKNKTFKLPNSSITIYPSTTAWGDVGTNGFKASDFPNHRFMLRDGYNKEIREGYYSGNYTNWIYIFNDPESDNIYLRAEDDINGSQTITWSVNAPVESPYVFVDQFNTAAGECSHVEGAGNIAAGDRGHIEGRHNEIKETSNNSHIEGFGNIAGSGNSAHIEGERNLTIGTGVGIHLEGRANVGTGTYSHVEGRNNFAQGSYSHAFGFGKRYPFTVDEKIEKTTTSATNTSSIEINLPVDEANTSVFMPAPDTATSVITWGVWYINKTKAIARRVGTMYKLDNKLRFTIRTVGNTGETITIDPTDDTYFYWGNVANGTASIAGGKESYASGAYSIALGSGTVTNLEGQIAIGKYNNINNTDLLIIGKGTDVLNRDDALIIAQNGDMTINGNEIVNGTANLDKIILGQGTVSGTNSIASGVGASATGANSIAIGKNTKASASGAIAVGTGSGNTTASGLQSIALGNATTASNKNTIAAGISSVASHETSFAFGNRVTTGADFSFNIGYYNNPTNNTLFSIGNGTNTTRSNALLLDRSGNLTVAGTIIADGENINSELENIREIVKLLKNASFSISGYFSRSFDFINNMTWEQFVNSPFNPTCDPWSFDIGSKTYSFNKIFAIYDNSIIVEYSIGLDEHYYTSITFDSSENVPITDIIANNTTYWTADA